MAVGVVVIVVVMVRVIVIVIVFGPRMIAGVGILARLEIALRRGRLAGALGHAFLEKHVHEHIHRLRLDDERARRLVFVAVVVLVDAVVVNDRDIAGFPVVA